MAFNIADINRRSSGYLLEALISGILFGIAPVLLKMASIDFYLSFYSIAAGILSLAGFFLMQRSLYSGHVSIVISLITALSIMTTFLLSIFIFDEFVSSTKWFGAAAIIFGAADLIKK